MPPAACPGVTAAVPSPMRTLAQQEKAGLGDLDDAAAVVENFGQELFLKAA